MKLCGIRSRKNFYGSVINYNEDDIWRTARSLCQGNWSSYLCLEQICFIPQDLFYCFLMFVFLTPMFSTYMVISLWFFDTTGFSITVIINYSTSDLSHMISESVVRSLIIWQCWTNIWSLFFNLHTCTSPFIIGRNQFLCTDIYWYLKSFLMSRFR